MAQEGFCIGNEEGGGGAKRQAVSGKRPARRAFRLPLRPWRPALCALRFALIAHAADSRRSGEFFDSRVVFRMDALGKHRARRRSRHETLKALQEAGSLKSEVRDRKSDLRSPT